MASGFRWVTFDVTHSLPTGWQQQVASAAAVADFRNFPRTPVISRESSAVRYISRGRLHADQVRQRLPWLHHHYRDAFRELAAEAYAGKVAAAGDDRYGVVLNVQRGTRMRFECHVDTNPLTGLLFCSDHVNGGELVIAHDTQAESVEDVEERCTVIRPSPGHLIFFDGRAYPHYVRPLTSDSDTRVVAVMNYYTEAFPETTRPAELNRHLYGDE